MEQEQYSSPYLSKYASLVKSAEYYSDNINKSSSFFYHHSKIQNLNLRLVSKIQTLLDLFSSKESLIYIPYSSLPKQFENVLEILSKSNIVNTIYETNTRYNDAPRFLRYTVQSDNAPEKTDGRLLQNIIGKGFGSDSDSETLFSKAVGEFLERYVLTVYRKKDFQLGSYRDMGEIGYKALHPLHIAGFDYSKRVDLKVQHIEDLPFYWVKAKRIYNNRPYWIPAQLVYWNYREDNEFFLRESNTNGAGGFFTRERALLSGLYELIQRDAFLIYWLNTLSPPKINPKTVPHKEFQKLIEEAERYGFNIHCLNTMLDTDIPSFIVVVEDLKKNWPCLAIGGGCEANPAQALYSALLEAWAVYYFVRKEEPFELPINYKPFTDNYIGRSQRLRFWGDTKNIDKFLFFVSGEEKRFSDYNFSYPSGFSSDVEELREAVCRVESLGEGYEVLGYIAKHRLLNKLNYFVAKVIVPSFVPLYLYEQNASLGAQRLKILPEKLKFLSSKLNPWPHPFP